MIQPSIFINSNERIMSTTRRLVEIETPSHDKAALDRLGDLLSHILSRLGARVTLEPQPSTGNHMVARWGRPEARQRILVLCHMDTVHPIGTLQRNPLRVQDGKLYGPGTLDMKGGIAIMIETLSILRETGQLPDAMITALITADEETGSHTSRELIESLAAESTLVLCLEASLPNGELKTWRKGVGSFQLNVLGRAAHAGVDPKHGQSAIEELAHQILAIQKMSDWDKGTTLNIGVIRGGTASNVIPEEAHADIDLRFLDIEEGERVTRQLKSLTPVLQGTTLRISGGVNRPPMPRDSKMVSTFEKAQEIALRIGLDLQEGGTGGGSDANFVAPLGVAVLDGLGPRGNGAHSEREYLWIDSLGERAALLAALLTGW